MDLETGIKLTLLKQQLLSSLTIGKDYRQKKKSCPTPLLNVDIICKWMHIEVECWIYDNEGGGVEKNKNKFTFKHVR